MQRNAFLQWFQSLLVLWLSPAFWPGTAGVGMSPTHLAAKVFLVSVTAQILDQGNCY